MLTRRSGNSRVRAPRSPLIWFALGLPVLDLERGARHTLAHRAEIAYDVRAGIEAQRVVEPLVRLARFAELAEADALLELVPHVARCAHHRAHARPRAECCERLDHLVERAEPLRRIALETAQDHRAERIVRRDIADQLPQTAADRVDEAALAAQRPQERQLRRRAIARQRIAADARESDAELALEIDLHY